MVASTTAKTAVNLAAFRNIDPSVWAAPTEDVGAAPGRVTSRMREASLLSERALGDQHLMRGPERIEPGRDPAIGGRVQQSRLDLVDRDAVVERALDVQLDLRRAVER